MSGRSVRCFQTTCNSILTPDRRCNGKRYRRRWPQADGGPLSHFRCKCVCILLSFSCLTPVKTEEDFAQIAGAGLNWIRLPIPFNAFGTLDTEVRLHPCCDSRLTLDSPSSPTFRGHTLSKPSNGRANMVFASTSIYIPCQVLTSLVDYQTLLNL